MVHRDVPALQKQWVLNAQWTDIPEEVEAQVQALWRFKEFGNDHYIFIGSIDDLVDLGFNEPLVEEWIDGSWKQVPLKTDLLVEYLKGKGVLDNETVYIHWWW